jgi:hypothetical protein
MEKILETYLAGLKVGRKEVYKNMAVYPLLSSYDAGLGYLLLDEALTQGLIEVVEISKEGAVPELRVINNGRLMVLILDGEELVGAKQNRVVNTTIVVKGGATVVIPVSCVEQGRWSYRSTKFATEDRMMSSRLRAMKAEQVNQSVREDGRFRANQGVIWQEIANKARRRGAPSPSMAMAAIYEKDRPSLDEYVKHFHFVDSQVGAVFMINGEVTGLDAFGRAETFSKTFRKLLESYALDAIDWYEPEKEHKILKSQLTAFLNASLTADTESHTAVGSGIDYRLSSSKVTGFALTLEERILHLSIFARLNGNNRAHSPARMARFSRRSGYRV